MSRSPWDGNHGPLRSVNASKPSEPLSGPVLLLGTVLILAAGVVVFLQPSSTVAVATPTPAEVASTPAPAPAAPARPVETPAAPTTPSSAPSRTSTGVAATAGVLEGVVRLEGTPPPEREITPVRADRLCGALHTVPVMTRRYTVGADRGLPNVVVSLVALPEGVPFSPVTESPLMDQVGCMYEPLVTTVMTNQPFRVRNSDPLMHNVNAQAKVNKGFNFAQATQGQVNEKSFPLAESPIKLICNVHPWMSAYVHVFPHPFHTVTDRNGQWRFPQALPPGKYALRISHITAGTITVPVEITAAVTPRTEASLAVPAT